MRKIILIALATSSTLLFASESSLTMAAFLEATTDAAVDKRKTVMQEKLNLLKSKIEALEKPGVFDLTRLDLIVLKNQFEPLVELAIGPPDSKKCALTAHELEAYTDGDGEPSVAVEKGKALIALFCPTAE